MPRPLKLIVLGSRAQTWRDRASARGAKWGGNRTPPYPRAANLPERATGATMALVPLNGDKQSETTVFQKGDKRCLGGAGNSTAAPLNLPEPSAEVQWGHGQGLTENRWLCQMQGGRTSAGTQLPPLPFEGPPRPLGGGTLRPRHASNMVFPPTALHAALPTLRSILPMGSDSETS